MVIQRVMWSLFVVFESPPVGRFSDILQIAEQVLIEHLFSIGSIESFDKGVLVGFAALDGDRPENCVVRPAKAGMFG